MLLNIIWLRHGEVPQRVTIKAQPLNFLCALLETRTTRIYPCSPSLLDGTGHGRSCVTIVGCQANTKITTFAQARYGPADFLTLHFRSSDRNIFNLDPTDNMKLKVI